MFQMWKRSIESKSTVKMYDHENGLAVPDRKEKQWVSFECKKCGYNTSWSKILNAKESRLRQSYKTKSTGGRKN